MIKCKNKEVNKSNNNKLVVILYSEAKEEYFATHEVYLTEVEVFPRSKIVKKYIEKLGYKVILLPGNFDSIKKLNNLKPFIVFNLVDSIYGKEDLSPLIPAALELIKVPYTGASVNGLTINQNKYLTKIILRQNYLKVPNFQLFFTENELIDRNLQFPLILKLNQSHGSLEINQDSVVENEKDLRKRIKYLILKYKQTVLVEEYITGKEITALMIDDHVDKLFLAEERIFFKKEKYSLFGFEVAWGDVELYDVKKYILNKKIKTDIAKAFNILEMKDYARFEIIIDKYGKYYFIDPNANPAFGPYGTGEALGYMLYANNIPFELIIKKIIRNVRARFKNK